MSQGDNQHPNMRCAPNETPAIRGASAIIPVLYYGLMLNDIAPPLIQTTNKTGITLEALVLWFFVGLFGVQICSLDA